MRVFCEVVFFGLKQGVCLAITLQEIIIEFIGNIGCRLVGEGPGTDDHVFAARECEVAGEAEQAFSGIDFAVSGITKSEYGEFYREVHLPDLPGVYEVAVSGVVVVGMKYEFGILGRFVVEEGVRVDV